MASLNSNRNLTKIGKRNSNLEIEKSNNIRLSFSFNYAKSCFSNYLLLYETKFKNTLLTLHTFCILTDALHWSIQ